MLVMLQFPYPHLPVLSITAALVKYSCKEVSVLIWKVASLRECLCSVNTASRDCHPTGQKKKEMSQHRISMVAKPEIESSLKGNNEGVKEKQ